jgi:hypothetical protein
LFTVISAVISSTRVERAPDVRYLCQLSNSLGL